MLTPPTDPGCCTAPRPATHSVLLQSIVSAGRLTRRDSLPAMLTSQALDWPGVLLEAGKNDVAAVDDVVGDRHYLSLNVDTKPLTLEVKGPSGFRPFTILPLSAWVSPGHDPLTLRLNSALRYLRVAIDALHLGRLMGRSPDEAEPLRLRRTYGVAAPQIARLMLTLRDEADSRNPGGLAVVEAVTTALGHLLVRHAGVERVQPLRARGGLSGVAKRRALELIDARLDARLTVDMLAREVGLSPAHFARVQGDSRPGAPPVSAVASSRARSSAARAVRCRPLRYRTAHGLRRPGSLHSPLQAGLRHHPGRPHASVAVLSRKRRGPIGTVGATPACRYRAPRESCAPTRPG